MSGISGVGAIGAIGGLGTTGISTGVGGMRGLPQGGAGLAGAAAPAQGQGAPAQPPPSTIVSLSASSGVDNTLSLYAPTPPGETRALSELPLSDVLELLLFLMILQALMDNDENEKSKGEGASLLVVAADATPASRGTGAFLSLSADGAVYGMAGGGMAGGGMLGGSINLTA